MNIIKQVYVVDMVDDEIIDITKIVQAVQWACCNVSWSSMLRSNIIFKCQYIINNQKNNNCSIIACTCEFCYGLHREP